VSGRKGTIGREERTNEQSLRDVGSTVNDGTELLEHDDHSGRLGGDVTDSGDEACSGEKTTSW
jgi:hypothetical protein